MFGLIDSNNSDTFVNLESTVREIFIYLTSKEHE